MARETANCSVTPSKQSCKFNKNLPQAIPEIIEEKKIISGFTLETIELNMTSDDRLKKNPP